MKKFFFLLFALSALGAQAQLVSKGGIMVGGYVSFETKNDNRVWQVEPTLAYFFANNAAAGLSVSYSTLSAFSAFKYGPFIRYYTNFGLFGHGGLNYISRKAAKDNFDLALGLGYAAFLGDQVSLEPVLSVVLLDGEPYARFNIALQVYFNR